MAYKVIIMLPAKHRFMMLYRIQDKTVIVDGMFHELQDYEEIFTREMKFKK